MDRENKNGRVIDLFGSRSRMRPVTTSGGTTNDVSGSYNIIGDRNTIVHARNIVQKLAGDRSACRRGSNWRAKHYRAIWRRSRELGLTEGDIYYLIQDRLGVSASALSQLADDDLERLFNIVYTM